MLYTLLELQTPAAWALFAMLIISGLCATISLMRVGIRQFWTPQDHAVPRLRLIETLPIIGLMAASLAMVVHAQVALTYTRATAESLHAPKLYIDAVMSARPIVRGPGATP
jgi:multicomponent K+:H+ antiporter subunit D